MPFDVFISYSSQDKVTANTACAALEAAGIRCWIAPRDIRAGIEYAAGIVEAIDASRLMVLIFSASANASAQVHREIEHAFSKSRTIVPFRIEDCAPTDAMEYYLGPVHWLDALTPPLAEHIGRLVEQVRAILQIDVPGGATPPVFEKPAPKLWPADGAEKGPNTLKLLQWVRRNAALLALICVIGALGAAVFLLWLSPAVMVTRTAAFGGNGGVAFDDLDVNQSRSPVSAIKVIVNLNPQDRAQQVIGGLQVRWGSTLGALRGGKMPSAQPVAIAEFAEGERIGRVDVASASYHYKTDDDVSPQWVSGLRIWTDRTVYPFGDITLGHIDQCILGSSDVLLGFYGRSGVFVDQIGCIIGRTK